MLKPAAAALCLLAALAAHAECSPGKASPVSPTPDRTIEAGGHELLLWIVPGS